MKELSKKDFRFRFHSKIQILTKILNVKSNWLFSALLSRNFVSVRFQIYFMSIKMNSRMNSYFLLIHHRLRLYTRKMEIKDSIVFLTTGNNEEICFVPSRYNFMMFIYITVQPWVQRFIFNFSLLTIYFWTHDLIRNRSIYLHYKQ